jgi:universal stress protein E
MKPQETLLVVIPPAATKTPAVRRAVELAHACNARLHLCVFVHDPAVELAGRMVGGTAVEAARTQLLREAEDRLALLADDLRGQDLQVEAEVVWGALRHELAIAKVVQTRARLVIKDARRSSALRKALFTPVDWQLMRVLPCSLMLVQPGSLSRPKRIAAAVDVLAEPGEDDGPGSLVLDTALRMARCLDARLELASVFPYLPVHGHALLNAEQVMDQAAAEHQNAFRRFAARHGVPRKQCCRLSGPPADALARYVEEHHIEMIAIGATRRGAWDRALLGSTAEALVQEIDADLLLVRPQPERPGVVLDAEDEGFDQSSRPALEGRAAC